MYLLDKFLFDITLIAWKFSNTYCILQLLFMYITCNMYIIYNSDGITMELI